MIDFKETTKRAQHGPMVSSRDFDLQLFIPKMREVVREFGIQYDSKNPIPADDDLADRVFEAGVKFYENVGTYCVDTERIIRFTRAEIKEALRDAPQSVYFGQGSDRKMLVARQPDCSTLPWCPLGAAGAGVSSERVLSSLVEGYTRLPLADSITLPGLTVLDGEPITAGSPSEVEGAIRATVLARESLRRGGRPGIAMVNGVSTAVTGRATIAASQFGFRETDGWEIASIAELRTNFDLLGKVPYILSVGGNILAETGPILGGLAGGPEGVAVLNVAYHLEGIIVKRGCLHHPFPIHASYGCGTGRDVLWAHSISTQAISRNSHFPMLNLGYTAAGPMTKMALYETAAWVVAAVVSGGNIEAEGVAGATHVDYLTPFEPRLASEVAHAAAAINRSHGNQIVNDLLVRYENGIASPPLGKKYQECWDVDAGVPIPEYCTLYDEVKGELRELGLKL